MKRLGIIGGRSVGVWFGSVRFDSIRFAHHSEASDSHERFESHMEKFSFPIEILKFPTTRRERRSESSKS